MNITSLNKNVNKIAYKKKGLTEINENLGYFTLIVQFFLTFEVERNPCSPIFIPVRCTCENLTSRSRTAQAQLLNGRLSNKLSTTTTNQIMIVISHSAYMSMNFLKVRKIGQKMPFPAPWNNKMTSSTVL